MRGIGNVEADNRFSGKDPEPISVSQALRTLPETAEGHSEILKVRGVISSLRPVFKMVSGEVGECPKCGTIYVHHYDKPVFDSGFYHLRECREENSMLHPTPEQAKYDSDCVVKTDKDENVVDYKILLKNVRYEYRNALIVEIQDEEKFDDLEKLQVILFDNDTIDIRAGEQVTIIGQIYIEKLGSRDSRLSSRLYAHSIQYEARREVTLSNQDKGAIERFVARFGNNTISKLTEMLAPSVIGYEHVKKGLLLSAASCSNDFKSSRTFRHRIRLHCILVGDPGLAKSVLLREIIQMVPNSRFESGQNSSGKSLTAIVSKEGGENNILRLGPIPLAKEGICAVNELGRMSFEDQAPLLDVMEEGEFSINKYGMNAHIRSPTVIIGSANPTSSKWSNNSEDGKISLDDIPAIKPLIDRFDMMFIFRTPRDVDAIRKYTYTKSVYEDAPIPDYNPYIEKHLLYAKQFNPRISDDAKMMLSEYYIGIARQSGSPRVRETIFNIARMIARLNLKYVVDADDAKEACQFYNVILNEHEQVVNIPSNPRDITFEECLYTLEATRAPITFEDLIQKVCNKDEYIRIYIGDKHKMQNNIKLRPILDMLLNHTRVKRIGLKPLVLQWTSQPTSESKETDSKNNKLYDAYDAYDVTVTSAEDQKSKRILAIDELGVKTDNVKGFDKASHESYTSYSDNSNVDTTSVNEYPSKCYYCNIGGFSSQDEYEKHGVKCHNRLPLYPGLSDLKKLTLTPQGMPWEQELPRETYFEFELDPDRFKGMNE